MKKPNKITNVKQNLKFKKFGLFKQNYRRLRVSGSQPQTRNRAFSIQNKQFQQIELKVSDMKWPENRI